MKKVAPLLSNTLVGVPDKQVDNEADRAEEEYDQGPEAAYVGAFFTRSITVDPD
jgi:hypothetical protein